MKLLLATLVLLLSGCSSLHYTEWRPGMRPGFTWVDETKCEKLTIGVGFRYSKCLKNK